MRLLAVAALIAALPWVANAAPTWQTISSEPGKRIELDSTSIKREEGGKVQAQGRVILEKELIDGKSGAGYRVIEAITRYDCTTRNASTIKRIFKKNETEVIREEEIKTADLPVRSGTLDDKVLREVCRPPKEGALEIAQKANDAAGQLKQANEALLKKELGKADKAGAMKASDAGHGAKADEHAPVPSIRPNLKALVEANKVPSAPVAHEEHAPPAPKVSPIFLHTEPAHKVAKAPKKGYMLELTHVEAAQEHAHIHWSYDGEGSPANWSKLDPKNAVCATGDRQSPIDIRDGIKVDLAPIQFDYRPSTFRIIDNGHTIQANIGDSTITVTGKTYELIQFHFHKPSEEKVNGRAFDMVAHLVHKSDDGKLAVVAVLMERGSENPFIQTLWNNLPLEKNVAVEPPDMVINPLNFLPAVRNYYTYIGSLTTPPCTEGVLWLVMKQPVQISTEQIGIFSRLYRNNARPIQTTSGRLIKEGR
jgi:carbonic anhydrase